MDASLVALIAVLALGVLVAAVVFVMRARRAGEAGLSDRLLSVIDLLKEKEAASEGRLAQLAESQVAVQAQLDQRLQAQERYLSEALQKRLDEIKERLNEGLQSSATKTLETIGKLDQRLAVIDEAQKNIRELGSQIVGLQDILGNKQAQGAFGETRLETLVTDMLPPSAYGFQVTLSNGRRVDCLIRLPLPPGSVPIDAKFPLDSYEALRQASDEAGRTTAQRAFRAALTQHIKDIAEKYILPGETAEWALMFLPSEAVYGEIHVNFRDLVELAQRSHVLIVSPTTLWATLLGVRAVLRDSKMNEQAAVIRGEVAAMLRDVTRLAERVENLRRHFGQAESDLREIETSARKVSGRAERIEAIEIERPPAEPPPAEPQAAEPRLVEGGE